MAKAKYHRPATALPAQGSRQAPIRQHWGNTWRIAPALIACVLLGGAIAAVYARAVHVPFIFDDRIGISQNPSITTLWPLWGDAAAPGPLNPPRDLVTSGRPLANLSLAMNYHFGRLDPTGYHLFSMALHTLTAIVLWGTVRRLLRSNYFQGKFARAAELLSLLIALVWALHPLQTEAVVYASQRTELMMGFCYLATLYASLRYWAAASPWGRAAWLLLAILACFSGMACKEVMVSAPVIVLLAQRTFVAGSFRKALSESWPLYVGLFASWALLLALNISGPRSESAGFGQNVPAYVWWFTQAKVLVMYLKLAFWPWPLVIHYEMPYLSTLSVAWPWVLPVALAGVGIVVLFWRGAAVGFLGIWMLAILSPTLLVPITTEVAAERRMYLPSAALVAAVMVGGYALTQRLRSAYNRDKGETATVSWPGVVSILFAVTLALVFGLLSVRRLAAYHDEMTLWQDALIHQPENSLAHSYLAHELVDAGRQDEAIDHFRQAVRLQPNFSAAQRDLGLLLVSAGRPQEAIEHFEQALRLEPNSAEAEHHAGLALALAGRPQEALAHFQRAVQLAPDSAGAEHNLGLILASLTKPQEASAHFERAIELKPDYLDPRAELAKAYAATHRSADAIATAEQALRLAKDRGQQEQARQIEAWLTAYRKRLARPAGQEVPE